MKLKDVSEWTIFIDDVEGELAMSRRDCGGRDIEVLAKEEIMPFVDELKVRNTLLMAKLIELSDHCDSLAMANTIATEEYSGLLMDYHVARSELDKFKYGSIKDLIRPASAR